jgi:hypothetical protein
MREKGGREIGEPAVGAGGNTEGEIKEARATAGEGGEGDGRRRRRGRRPEEEAMAA